MRRFILAIGAAALLVLASLAPVTANELPTGPGESRCSANSLITPIGVGVAAAQRLDPNPVGPWYGYVCNPNLNP